MPDDILRRIVADKVVEVQRRRGRLPFALVCEKASEQKPPRDFIGALRDSARLPVIAEIKRRSPSRGILRAPFSPFALAREFANSGAACLSVLTDRKFFGGGGAHLKLAKAAGLPILRKDFILDEWQIAESRAMGADAILLIAAMLNGDKLQQLASAAAKWQMAVLIETHDEEEAQTALAVPNALIGINNRNLRTFAVDINTTINIAPLLRRVDAARLIVAESGILDNTDIDKLRDADAFLIGETLMRAKQPGVALRKLFNKN